MKVLYILCGIPGSGKSTYAKALERKFKPTSEDDYTGTVSADNFFMHNGEYLYDKNKIGEAHKTCLLKFLQLAQHPCMKQLIVDNTNLSVEDIAPYAAIGEAMGFTVQIHRIHCDPETAANRNVHGVPSNKVLGMHHRFKLIRIPKRWVVIDVGVEK